MKKLSLLIVTSIFSIGVWASPNCEKLALKKHPKVLFCWKGLNPQLLQLADSCKQHLPH